jgi:hypothetical protein
MAQAIGDDFSYRSVAKVTCASTAVQELLDNRCRESLNSSSFVGTEIPMQLIGRFSDGAPLGLDSIQNRLWK